MYVNVNVSPHVLPSERLCMHRRESYFFKLITFFFGVMCATAMFSVVVSCGDSGTFSALGKKAGFSLSVDRATLWPFMWIVNLFFPAYHFVWSDVRMLEWFSNAVFPDENVCGLF